jgi:hypothetical protein
MFRKRFDGELNAEKFLTQNFPTTALSGPRVLATSCGSSLNVSVYHI